MKKKLLGLILLVAIGVVTGCKKDKDDDPVSKYPAGAIVWPKDTVVTITDHYIVPVGKSLYIEEGVQVIMDTTKRPEFIVLGNLYCYGTAEKPILFSVTPSLRTESNRFARLWGGIICGYDAKEVLLKNTIIEYTGAQTTEESASFQLQLFKTETGEGVPGFHFCNTDGKFVIDQCTFRNNGEDAIYITGGKSIIMRTKIYHTGFDGGDAINYKSDCLADLAYNIIYDVNTNAFKLSNSGLQFIQSHLFVYNNTVVNSGWRRPKVKGGSIWLEDNVRAELYNNLLYDVRHPVKHDVSKPEDSRSVITPNYWYASTQAGIDNYTATAGGELQGANDKVSTTPGSLNPLFFNFTQQANVDIMCGITQSGNVPQSFNTSWDFGLKTGSPALTGGVTNFSPHFRTTGIVLDNKEYKSPAPSLFFGAYAQK